MESLSKNHLSHLRKYLKKSIRKQHRKFLVEGNKMISEALENGFEVDTLVYEMGKGKDHIDLISHKNVNESFNTNRKNISAISDVEAPQGITALINYPEHSKIPGNSNEKIILALDSISDPGNLGTIIRSASWFGIEGVICSKNSVEIFNSKVIRSSMGGVFHIPIWEEVDLVDTLSNLKKKDYKILGTSPSGKSLSQINSDKIVIVIGNEARGVSEEVGNICNETVCIPGTGSAESLNAAVSAGIIMYNIVNGK